MTDAQIRARTPDEDVNLSTFVTMTVDQQLCGIPVMQVRDVIVTQAMTRIPLAPPEIAGSLNLRGRIVTAVDLRRRLQLAARQPGETSMSVVVEWQGELYSLVVDKVGEVMRLAGSTLEQSPSTLRASLRDFATGIYQLQSALMLVLNTDRVLSIN